MPRLPRSRRFRSCLPRRLLTPPELTRDSTSIVRQINGAFVGGRALSLSSASARSTSYLADSSCTPPKSMLGFSYPLHHVQPPDSTTPQCGGHRGSRRNGEIVRQAAGSAAVPCDVLRSLRFEQGRPLRTLLLAVNATDLLLYPIASLSAVPDHVPP